jgi:HAD superfamily hydrolase (TIGR01662 family)
MTTARSGIRCLLFDLGSTLWTRRDAETVLRYERAAEANAVAAVRSTPYAGISMPRLSDPFALDGATWGRHLRELVHAAIKTAHQADPGIEPDFAAITRDILHGQGIAQANESLGAAVYESLRVRSLHTRALFDDVLPTLATLRARGYALGVVTNRSYGGPVFLDDLDQMGLLRVFDPRHIAISADLRYRKPHPNIFRYALARLGYTLSETAMVGDQLGADILGSNYLGMFSIWKPKPGETETPGEIVPDATITHIADLLAMFP